MTILHLSEEEIQDYTDGLSTAGQQAHVAACASCKLRLSNYQSLFSELQTLDRPAFDFDLATLVLAQLPTAKAQYPWLPALAAVLSVIFCAVIALCYGSLIGQFIKGMSQIWLLILLCPGAILLSLQALHLYQDYQSKLTEIKLQDLAT